MNEKRLCDNRDQNILVIRATRATGEATIHYGLIASGDRLMKRGETRDLLGQELGIPLV